MSNYPLGTGPNDKAAPWNEKDQERCEACDGYGTIDHLNGASEDKCPDCNGLGFIEEDEEDHYDKELCNQEEK